MSVLRSIIFSPFSRRNACGVKLESIDRPIKKPLKDELQIIGDEIKTTQFTEDGKELRTISVNIFLRQNSFDDLIVIISHFIFA
jgi:hypothetical protein